LPDELLVKIIMRCVARLRRQRQPPRWRGYAADAPRVATVGVSHARAVAAQTGRPAFSCGGAAGLHGRGPAAGRCAHALAHASRRSSVAHATRRQACTTTLIP
jgi:hypothetical protein